MTIELYQHRENGSLVYLLGSVLRTGSGESFNVYQFVEGGRWYLELPEVFRMQFRRIDCSKDVKCPT